MKKILLASAVLIAASTYSYAQSPSGAAAGAVGGAAVGGVVGGPVGAAVGAATGAAVGGLTGERRDRFRTYVRGARHPSYKYDGRVAVGAVLPETGVTYYEVPAEYGVSEYRYTIVDDTPVLVEPRVAWPLIARMRPFCRILSFNTRIRYPRDSQIKCN